MSSRNQSRPIARPSCSGSLISTLAPPNRVAASANSIPVKARIFFFAQHRGHDAEDDRPDDDALDQHPHEVHGIVRPQLGRRQQLREMQAHHRAEREQPEEGRENPAPPAGAEPAGLVVSEHLVDLPFEHGSLVRFVARAENT